VRERLLTQAFEPLADAPVEFGELIRKEIANWARVVKDSGARAE
jgi:tripartite-type tricarboxylate transporter receptor subunit TctC